MKEKMDLTLPIKIRQYFHKESILIIDNIGLTWKGKNPFEPVLWSDIVGFSSILYGGKIPVLRIRAQDVMKYREKSISLYQKLADGWTEDTVILLNENQLNIYHDDLDKILLTLWEIHRND